MITMKQVHISTFGCQMNDRDSELIAQILSAHDYRLTQRPEEADLILINTCSIRQKAEEKTYSLLGRLKRLKSRNPELIIGVGGCVAQQEGDRLLERIPYLDLVFGTRRINELPDLIQTVRQQGRRLAEVGMDRPVRYRPSERSFRSSSIKASVTIMHGCNNYCAYCVVPYVRGPEWSRPEREILEEVRSLAAQGVKEVLLLGQNVNSYGSPGRDGPAFVALLEKLEPIEGLERLRFTTSHPKDLSPALIGCFGRLSKLCEHIHLPFQAGANTILARMNRRYTREMFLERIRALRERCPEMAITSDVMVGFPGEKTVDFEQTLDLIREIGFDDLFSFRYSDRHPAQASGFPDKVPEEEKRRRLSELQALQRGITLARHRGQEGTWQPVLVEGISKKGGREWTGRTRTNKVVHFNADQLEVGLTVAVYIEKGYAHSLRGTLSPQS
ncbi:MAG: tRNA (N6-isopentenyl adenosine(37)-C2)-methylthiotransferase MiaB [Deltaproteobacteria bacterium]|nr:tRNA (N6-isopentenyl adenosine(37)-C2)-methylthiotransferase MiaB [Deltaproteobacteria bacterium]